MQHGFHTVGHFLLLFRGQLGKHTVGGRLLGGLFHGLLCLPLLLKLGKVAVDGGNQLMGCGPDGFKGRPQLFQVFAGTPTGHIPKGIVRRVQPVVLADGIGHALGLHLAGAAVGPVGLFGHGGLRVNGVELGMGNLMDGRFQGLQLTHVLLNGDPLVNQVVVAMRTTGDVLKGHRDGGSLFQRLEEVLVLLHIPGQLVHTDRGQRFALGLAHVKDRHNLERRNLDFFFLGDGVAVLVYDRLALFVQLRHFLFHLVGGGGQNLDTFLAPLHIAVKIVPPLVVARHKLAALHGDQQRIVETVTVELRHRGEIGFVAFTLEKLLYAGFQPVSDLFHAVCAVLAVENDGDDGRRGRSFGGGRCLRLHRPGRGLVPQNFRRGIGHHPVFLRHRLALMDALPLVAAFHQIAIGCKYALFLPGDMLAETGGVNSGFPFLRHFHHAGTVQVVVGQLFRSFHVGQMHIVVHIVGVVDDLADAVKTALRILQGGVQLRKLGGVQLFQPRGKEVQFVHIGGQHHVIGDCKASALRVGKPVDEKILRVVGADVDFAHGFLQLLGGGRQVQPVAMRPVLLGLGPVINQNGKHFAHWLTPFCNRGGYWRFRLRRVLDRLFCLLGCFALHGISGQQKTVDLEMVGVFFGDSRGNFGKQMLIGFNPAIQVFVQFFPVGEHFPILSGNLGLPTVSRRIGIDAPIQRPRVGNGFPHLTVIPCVLGNGVEHLIHSIASDMAVVVRLFPLVRCMQDGKHPLIFQSFVKG